MCVNVQQANLINANISASTWYCVCVCVLHPHILQNPAITSEDPWHSSHSASNHPHQTHDLFSFQNPPPFPREGVHMSSWRLPHSSIFFLSQLYFQCRCVCLGGTGCPWVCVCVCVCVCVRLSSSSWEVFNLASIEPNELLNYLSLLPWWTVTVVNTKTTKERDLCV